MARIESPRWPDEDPAQTPREVGVGLLEDQPKVGWNLDRLGEFLGQTLVRIGGAAPAGIWDALVTQANEAGFEVIRERKGSANGYCDFVSGRIGVRPDIGGLQAVKTLIHELGHALLHKDETPSDRSIAEVEVESVASVVLDALGLASDNYSFPYVARWASGQVETVKATGDRVVTTARIILDKVTLAKAPESR